MHAGRPEIYNLNMLNDMYHSQAISTDLYIYYVMVNFETSSFLHSIRGLGYETIPSSRSMQINKEVSFAECECLVKVRHAA